MNYMKKGLSLYLNEDRYEANEVLVEGVEHYLTVMKNVLDQTPPMDLPLLILAAEHWCDLLRKSALLVDKQANVLRNTFADALEKSTKIVAIQKEGDER